jgi:uncharacterized membrane protein
MQLTKKNNFAIIIISLIGIIDSGYLSILKLSNNEVKCIAGLGNCDAVNSSSYSIFAGIPVAYLGFLSYLIMIGLIVLVMKEQREIPFATYSLFGIALIGFLFSGYLTFVELDILHAVCFFCLISAICMTIIFGLSLYKINKLLNN